MLGLCAAAELSPRYGRLFAYLQDDVTRKLASPRLVARLLGEAEVDAASVLACFEVTAPLRRHGAIRLVDAGAPTPLAERQVKVSDRLVSFLLAADLDDRPTDGRLRFVALPAYEPGRTAAVDELRGQLAGQSALPLVVGGPDAATLLAVALERPIVLADVGDAVDADVMQDAALAAALAGARLCFDGLEALDPGERRRAQRALAARGERVLLCARDRDAAVALGDQTAIVVEAPMPSLAERREAWRALADVEEVDDAAGKFRLSVGQIADAAEVARLAAAARGEAAPAPADLDLGARQASSTRIGELATRLEPAYAGMTSSCRPAKSRCSGRSRATCVTAIWCSPSGATSRRWPATKASRCSSRASRAPARRWPAR